MFTKKLLPLLLVSTLAAPAAHAAEPSLIAIGSLSSFADLSGLTGKLESGLDANVLGGIGSGLAWAGGNSFLALPDRGPNAVDYSITYPGATAVDNTTSYIARFQTVSLNLTAAPSGGLPYTLTPTLTGTTLLYSSTALNYGSTAGLPIAVPSGNSTGKNYFSGRSDNFAAGLSTNPANARLDPEGIRVSNDGSKIYVSDEYGPYVYQFDRASGQRTKTFTLPDTFAVANLNSKGATEISGNTSGRVANKGMEGLAISPDGKTLIGFEQSPLIQDGGDGGRANRIVTIDTASGATKQYVYDNQLVDPANPSKFKTYNSSEILALNDHQFLVLERDGKGLGDHSSAVVKRIFAVDLNGATDIGALNGGAGISGEANLLPYAVNKTLFLDLKTALNAHGISDADIPAKLEGMAFGQDIVENGETKHTLYVANDNDFVPSVAGDNKFFVFSFTDADLTAKGLGALQLQQIAAIPEPETYALMLAGLGLLGFVARRRNKS